MSLGSAFQKVNFLRDLKSDSEILNRVYFPNVDMKNFNENSKDKIIEEIEKDFEHALEGIVKLPKKARFGVYIAYRYYFCRINIFICKNINISICNCSTTNKANINHFFPHSF